MSIIEKIKSKLSARRTDAAAQYWATLQKVADGRLSERAADTAIESLAPVIEQLGKDGDAVEADLALLEQVREAESRIGDKDKAQQELRASFKAHTEASKRRDELRAEGDRLLEVASEHRRRCEYRMTTIAQAESDVAAARRALAKAGQPAMVAAVAEHDAQERRSAQIRQAEIDLAEVDRNIASAERSQGEREERPDLGRSDRIDAHLEGLRGKRQRLVDRLAELRGGEPIAEVTS